jgi:hypothetical protein
MIASYGEPNYKVKKHDYRSHTATGRKPQGTRRKETTGTAIRIREAYRRRREDSSDIGDETNKKVE